ncbi:MAG: lipid II flippase MurJ [Thermoplasmata archaeon]
MGKYVIYNPFLGLQNFKANTIISIISNTLAYGSIVPLLIINDNPLMTIVGWNIGYFTGTILTFLFLFKRMKYIESKPATYIKIKPIIYYSIPLFISGLIGYGATYVDRFIVSYFLNLSEMGIYNFSLLIVSSLSMLITPFGTILLPKLSEYYGKREYDKMRLLGSKAIEVLMAVYLPVALLVVAISQSILLFIANREHLPGYIPIITILVINSIFISSNIPGVTLQAIRKTRILLISSSFIFASNFILSVILIPRFGIDGAGIAFSSIYIMGFAVVFYYAKNIILLRLKTETCKNIHVWIFDVSHNVSGSGLFWILDLETNCIYNCSFCNIYCINKDHKNFQKRGLEFIFDLAV